MVKRCGVSEARSSTAPLLCLVALMGLSVPNVLATDKDQPVSSGCGELLAMPAWVRKISDDRKTGKSSVEAIYMNCYRGQHVFLVQKGCCDQLNPLYDENQKLICNPSGGFSGSGDGRCPDYPVSTQLKLSATEPQGTGAPRAPENLAHPAARMAMGFHPDLSSGTGGVSMDHPFAKPVSSAELPTGCWVPSIFPPAVIAAVPSREGHHGLELWAGTSRAACAMEKGCRLFTKPEFDRLWGASLSGFTDDALFAVFPCDLPTERAERMAHERTAMAKTLMTLHNQGVTDWLTPMLGLWCGRTLEEPGRAETQMRISFKKSGPSIQAHAVMTWPSTPGGPLGQAGYVDAVDLFPDAAASSLPLVTLREVSRYRTGRQWQLDTQTHRLSSLQNPPRIYALIPSCAGFWGPQPSTSTLPFSSDGIHAAK